MTSRPVPWQRGQRIEACPGPAVEHTGHSMSLDQATSYSHYWTWKPHP